MKEKLSQWIQGLKCLYQVLSEQQRRYALVVLACAIFGAFLETLGVSAILPLVSEMTQQGALMNSRWGKQIAGLLGITSDRQFLLYVCLAIIVLYLLKNIYFLFLSWIRVKYAYKIRREISADVMASLMKRPYDYFLDKTTGDLINRVTYDADGLYQVINQFFRMIIDSLIIFMIGVFIFIADWKVAVCLLILTCISLLSIVLFFHKKVRSAGKKYYEASAERSQVLMESFQGIKEVFVMHKQDYFLRKYIDKFIKMQQSDIVQTIAMESPAYVIEGICVIGLFGFVSIQLLLFDDIRSLLPMLSSVALGAFRILPALGRISSSLNGFLYYTPCLYRIYANKSEVEAYKDKKAVLPDQYHSDTDVDEGHALMGFESELMLKDVFWKYGRSEQYILNDVNLVISKGESVGIVGPSGAGKTTLIDIVLGLHELDEGAVLIDGINIQTIPESWSHLVGYVPQSLFLSNTSLRENIAFGVDESDINDERVWSALEQAQLADFVRGLPHGIHTEIGERGIRFSGGQLQRVAIARALYREPQILVLDEATSALDNETEAYVMEAIEHLQGKITMIIVAHRLTTIEHCDKVYEISGGSLRLRET